MKSKEEKRKSALEDSQGCLAFWENYDKTNKPDRVYVPSNADYARLHAGTPMSALIAGKIAHHKRMIQHLQAKL